tara:strand:- start:827 stop:1129 length:303 start_codon:yes stop_codon:yes gene_type:complete
MYKYKLINNFLDKTFPIEIKEKIFNYLLPNKNNHLKEIMKPNLNYKNSYYSIKTRNYDEFYNTHYYNGLIVQRCDICSHIVYIKFGKKEKKEYSYCKCYN